MIEEIIIPARFCICLKCLFEWISVTTQPPQRCRNQACRTKWWDGQKPQRRSHADEIKLPAPRTRGRPRPRISFDYNEDS
jgi:hypothetical protein